MVELSLGEKIMDDLTPEQRHKNMTHIRATDTKAEIMLRHALWHKGIRYRKNYKGLPGKPDIVITRCHIAIFVDGEFWHGRNFDANQYKIKSNRSYWVKKIRRNQERDMEINEILTEAGWCVLRFWESDIKKDLSGCIRQVLDYIPQSSQRGSTK